MDPVVMHRMRGSSCSSGLAHLVAGRRCRWHNFDASPVRLHGTFAYRLGDHASRHRKVLPIPRDQHNLIFIAPRSILIVRATVPKNIGGVMSPAIVELRVERG